MSGMTSYFIRRLLLVPVTFIAITLMVYAVLRIVPGGPIEQAETAMKMGAMSGEGGGGGGLGDEGGLALDEDALGELLEYYALDKPVLIGYGQWLGVVPRIKKKRVPPVDPNRHAEAIDELEKAQADLEQAQAAYDVALEKEGLVEFGGRVGEEPVADGDVPTEVKAKVERLLRTTFGTREPFHAYLESVQLVGDGTVYFRPVPNLTKRQTVFEARNGRDAARLALRVVEERTGYFLDRTEAGIKPQPLAFRPLLVMNRVRREATERLEGLLEPKEMLVSEGTIYLRMTDDAAEAATRRRAEDAEDLVKGGFGKRDELLAYLKPLGMTWKKGAYYLALSDDELRADTALSEDVPSLVHTRHLADSELRRIEDERNFEVSKDGLVYSLASRFSGILQLDFGTSYLYNESVLSTIGSKMEVSIQFGLIGYLLTWLICVPLGVFKAIKHKSFFDTASSVVVFLGYSIPGFVLCLILLSTVAPAIGLPLGGYKPDNIDQLGWWDSFAGRVRHMLIPVAGYMVTQFAAMTILMKNSLLENLGQDYVRTAFAKGLTEKRVIFVHALRNSLIPITAGIGHALGLLFAGSFLIEKTCNVDGMGLLGYNAIVGRDYPIILGILVFGVLIRLFGNILSDIIWALIDPRIRFG